jgi:uncharacterized repeat protein (TIGR02543 family)
MRFHPVRATIGSMNENKMKEIDPARTMRSRVLITAAVLGTFFIVSERSVQAGTITFNANGGTGAMDSVNLSKGDDLPSCEFSRYGYVFRGWSEDKNAQLYEYEDNGEVDTDSDLTLYALWEPQLYLIHYDANGGFGEMADSYAIYDEESPLNPNKFSHQIFRFDGWVDDEANHYENNASVYDLHSGNTYSQSLITVDAGKPKNTKYSFLSTQGSCVYEEDGTMYLVTAAMINDSAYYKGDLSHYETVLTKYDLSTGKAVARARNLDFDHGNGICYNEDNGHLYIAEGGSEDGYASGVMEVDENLKFVKEWTFPLLTNIWSIAWHNSHFYLMGASSTAGHAFCVLNEDMQTLSITEVDEYYDQNFSAQGIAADDNFIYAVSAGFKSYDWKSKQRINVFTLDGTYVGVWTIDIPYEAEDITVIGPYAYITTNEKNKSTLYRTRMPLVTLHAVWKK